MEDEQQQNPEFNLPSPEELAALLPSYSEFSFLAQGGMAAVYRAVQTSLERPVAIKVLPREYGADESFRLRFQAEAKTMARLNHPNLVGIFDFGEIDGLLYLVMEFVEGESLYEYAYQKPLEGTEAVDIALRIADGLAHAHEHQVLHRDIKPANILLAANEKNIPKLGDFGLAHGGEREEGDDLVFGTPGYTAPEVMTNPEAASLQADIYSIGILLYELLTTQIPTNPYSPPSRLVQSDTRIDDLIARAIQPEPANRYQTTNELAEDLRNLRDKLKNQPRRKLAVAQGVQHKQLATADNPAPPPRQSLTPKTKGSFDFTLVRNLIIIVGLCLAIWGITVATQKKKADIAQQQKETSSQTTSDPKNSETSQAPPQETNTPSPNRQDPSQDTEPVQLADLRSALRSGARDQFPDGSHARAGSRFFLVEKKLSWNKAIAFAEDHGGNLAILPTEDDLIWASGKIPSGEQIWLGAGAVSKTDWAWLDNTPFTHRKPSTRVGTAATLTESAILKSAKPSEKFLFFIQWNEDGSQAPQRSEALSKLASTLNSESPQWLPGTAVNQGRRYLVISGSTSQNQARRQAQSAGGDLAVASDESEANFLQKLLQQSGLESAWIGGKSKLGSWQWFTGEPWSFARWAPSAPDTNLAADALALNSQGWFNQNGLDDLAGFIIEWSNDAKNNAEQPQTKTTLDPEVAQLREKAIALATQHRDSYDKKIKDNTSAMGMSLRQWLRGITKQDSSKLQPKIDSYLQAITPTSQRLPDPKALLAEGLPVKGSEILSRSFSRQSTLDAELTTESEKLRTAYIKRIEEKIGELQSKNLKSKVRDLQAEIKACGSNGKTFLEYLDQSPFE